MYGLKMATRRRELRKYFLPDGPVDDYSVEFSNERLALYNQKVDKIKAREDLTKLYMNYWESLHATFNRFSKEEFEEEMVDLADTYNLIGLLYEFYLLENQKEAPFLAWQEKLLKQGKYGQLYWGGSGKFEIIDPNESKEQNMPYPDRQGFYVRDNEIVTLEIKLAQKMETPEGGLMRRLRRNNKLTRVTNKMVTRKHAEVLPEMTFHFELNKHAQKEVGRMLVEHLDALTKKAWEDYDPNTSNSSLPEIDADP